MNGKPCGDERREFVVKLFSMKTHLFLLAANGSVVRVLLVATLANDHALATLPVLRFCNTNLLLVLGFGRVLGRVLRRTRLLSRPGLAGNAGLVVGVVENARHVGF